MKKGSTHTLATREKISQHHKVAGHRPPVVVGKYAGDIKNCVVCGMVMTRESRKSYSNKLWERLRHCGNKCAAKTRAPWNKNKHNVYTPTTLAKMRKAKLGGTLPEKTREKIRRSNGGVNHVFWGKKREPFTAEARTNMGNAHRGEKSPAWKGGIYPIHKSIRQQSIYKEWRNVVFKRDNYTCVRCKKYGGTLNADHIKKYAIILEENKITSYEEALQCNELWDIDNGRTLCVPCHRKTETYGNKIN